MDIYKQICAKLVEAWDNTADGEYEDFGRAASYLVDWTRDALAEPEPEAPINWAAYFVRQAVVQEQELKAALAEPEPEGPTDEELDELAWNWYSKTGSTWWQVEAFRAYARAVLARWGK